MRLNNDKINIIIADDHALIRQGLKALLSLEEHIRVVSEVDDGGKVISAIKTHKPHILLMDINMPSRSGIDVLKEIKTEGLPVYVIVLTVESDRKTLLEAIEIGADGYVLKGSEASQIIHAIQTVMSGENYIDQSLVSILFGRLNAQREQERPFSELTNRELDILFLIAKGYSNRDISETLYLSEKTVKNNITRLFRKIEVKDRVHATIYARDHHIFEYYNHERT